jgi:chemotaxis protein CheD
MSEIIKVGMADLKYASSPSVLTTLGLGSCVGIALYDKKNKIAGLAHIMLPSSTQARNNYNEAKFADTAIVKLVEEMLKLGASKQLMVAKLAGGAQMFMFNDTSELMRIGEKNVTASKEVLSNLKIPIVSEDTGGNYGRTIELYSETGKLIVKTIGHGIKEI